jgi:hypothetical protein
MKGIVFSEFLEMVEGQMGEEMVDDLIDGCDLPSGGAYTSLGTYSHEEMVQLVKRLSALNDTPVPELLKVFGSHLLGRFAVLYPRFFLQAGSVFELLERVEDYIHVEVRKLYPDAELPSFQCQRPDAGTLVMIYSSARPFADLAEGLIQGCIKHYGEALEVARQDLEGAPGTRARFEVRAAAP